MIKENPLLKFSECFNEIYEELMLYSDMKNSNMYTNSLLAQQFMKAGKMAYNIKDFILNIPSETIENHEVLLEMHYEVMKQEETRYKKMEKFLKRNTFFKFTSEKVMRDKMADFGDPFFFNEIIDGYKKSMAIALRCSYEYELLTEFMKGKQYSMLDEII